MEFIAPELLEYAEAHSEPETEMLRDLNRQTHLKTNNPRMLSGHIQGRTLSLFSKLLAPKVIADVGTFTGYSALCLAEGLQPGGKLYTIDADEEIIAFAREYFDRSDFKDQIVQLHGDGVEMLKTIEEPINLAFLDAKKEQYEDYYEIVLANMPSGGLILADNVLWSGKVVDESAQDETTEAFRKFNNHVAHDDRVEKVLLPLRDGLFAARKK